MNSQTKVGGGGGEGGMVAELGQAFWLWLSWQTVSLYAAAAAEWKGPVLTLAGERFLSFMDSFFLLHIKEAKADEENRPSERSSKQYLPH